ncbi:MAG: hypothetical protein AB7I27_10245 [Bacteriovoracaceae bacterium]
MLKNLSLKAFLPFFSFLVLSSCATSSTEWQGDMSRHVDNYMNNFKDFREKICVPKAESIFEEDLKAYRGQGYWIPELREDVDVESIKSLLPEMENKLKWITEQENKLRLQKLPAKNVTNRLREILGTLLNLKKHELSSDEKLKADSRKESLKLLGELQKEFDVLTKKVSFLTNYHFPVDHLKNRKVFDSYREKEDDQSTQIANYTFLYRKLLEDGAYNKDHTGSDIYLRTTLDTLFFEIRSHDFYLTEDARFDLEFVLAKIESEIDRGKSKLLERMNEWKERTKRTYDFYYSLTGPDHQKVILVKGEKTTQNKELIKEHNRAALRLKEFVYKKQAEVYQYWLHQPELAKAIFVLETILLNEVGGVDGDDALERMDVARVVVNRLDKPKYLSIGKKEFVYPYLKKVTTDFHLQNERWLNALFKQGEFSFTYYYMAGVAKIFCPDMGASARRLRNQNVQIALQVLKDKNHSFSPTRYFSRASMIGRIHMDSIWEDYSPYPERPGLLAEGQDKLIQAFNAGDYHYLYSFKDPSSRVFQVLEIGGKNYALGEAQGVKIFYYHRNPHYFRYFTKTNT